MSVELRNKGQEFSEFMAKLSPEERAKGNQANLDSATKEYDRFLEDYSHGECYLCSKPLKSYSKDNPCIHWLLKPKGFKKKMMPVIADKFGYFQIQSLLRWYANQESFGKNINDLKEEGSGNKMFEVTIKYKNIEWSFSCAESDYLGHQNSNNSKHAHYHFQMRIDGRPFINYNDFHLPFSDMDIIHIEAMREKPELVTQRFTYGEGINELLDSEEILNAVVTAPGENDTDENDAPFKIDTFAYAEDGETINGEDLYNIIQEAKEKGVTIASLMHKLPNAKSQVIVSPGPGVVVQKPRNGGKRGKSHNK